MAGKKMTRARAKQVLNRARMKQAFRKLRSGPRIRKPLALKTHTFVERKVTDLVMDIGNEGGSYPAVGLFKSFNLNDINNSTEYKTLFEYYKINKVVVTFRYKSTGADGNTVQAYPRQNEINPLLYFKVDHNDISADSLLLMRQSMKTREKQFTNNNPEFTITLKPAIRDTVYKSASGVDTYVPKWGQWLSTDDGDVEHYGLKAYCVANKSSSVNPGQLIVQIKYYISFKNNE